MSQTIQDPRSPSGDQVFPAAWGKPPGTPFSPERARWVAGNIHNAAGRAPGRVRRETTAEAALRKVEEMLAEKDHRPAPARADGMKRSAHYALARAMQAALHP